MASKELNSKQLKQKINSQKEKIESLESTYETKINLLKSKKSKLETKANIGASLKAIPGATKKAESALAELETVNKDLEKLREEHDKKISEAKTTLSELKAKHKKSVATDKENYAKQAQVVKDKIKQNLFWYSMIVVIVGLILAIIALCLLGSVATIVLAIIALVFGAISAIYSIPTLIEQRKNNNIAAKTWFSVATTGIVVVMSVLALIINPIARSAVIAKEEAKAAKELAELAEECKKSLANVENNWKCSQPKYENEDFYYTTNDLKKKCESKGRRWKDSESICLPKAESDKIIAQEKAEEAENKLKSECSAKNYDWNYDAKRCNTDTEQKAKNAEREAERKRQEEANKTTTITGKDHDANDMAGKFNKLTDACLDRLDKHFPNTYPLDSGDGYPISYTATIKGDGTIVSGSMTGYHKTYYGNKILSYSCKYENGSAKILGQD